MGRARREGTGIDLRAFDSGLDTSAGRPWTALEGFASRELLEGLAQLHALAFAADGDGRIVWSSEALVALHGGALDGLHWTHLLPRLPDADQTLPLGRHLCEQGSLTDVRMALARAGGRAEAVDVSAFRVRRAGAAGPEASLTVAVLRRVVDRERETRELTGGFDLRSAVLEALPDGAVAIDRSGFVTWANAAAEELLGPGLRGKPLALFLPQANGFGNLLSRLRPPEEVSGHEIEVHGGSGRRAWISVSTRALRDTGGRPVGSLALLRDVTASRREREALERKNAELEGTVSAVSHDLRSPLVALLGFARLLRNDYGDRLDDTGLHFLDRVEQSGRTMETLIEDLLELSRIGRRGEQHSLVDPRAVLMQLQAELKPRIEEQRTRLLLPDDPPLVLCDRTRLYQLFSNLIGNALAHMGPCSDPEVRVDVRQDGRFTLLTVADNGKGLPGEERERIFEVFHTAGRRSDGGRSTGIGLAIVKKIAETHGGRVWVESEPGRGAAFHVTLPR